MSSSRQYCSRTAGCAALVVVVLYAIPVHAAAGLQLKQQFASPGAASKLVASEQYHLLFLQNSGSAVRVVDTLTDSQIDLHLATNQFTDIDLSPSGRYLYVADWGRVQIGYGTPIAQHYVHRYDLQNRTWQVLPVAGDAYKIEAVADDRFLTLESDQWVDVSLRSWSATASSILATRAADYYGDIEYDPTTGRIYHGNSGSSSHEINVLRVTGDTLQAAGGSGVYGTAQNGGGTSVLSMGAAERFYYGALQVEALDVTNNIRTFPQAIRAATANLAIGDANYYDPATGTSLGTFGYSTTVSTFTENRMGLWRYSNNTLYEYGVTGVVPEPLAGGTAVIGTAAAFMCKRRRGGRVHQH
jgi:hypothetical protein